MLLNANDLKILMAGCQYLENKDRVTKTMAHRIRMIQKDAIDNYGKSYLPSKARLKQAFHLMNELSLIDRMAFVKPLTYSDIENIQSQIKLMSHYEANTRFTHGDFPLIIKESGNEFFKRLEEWYFKNECIDSSMRHVQEIGMNLRIQND